MERDYSTKGNIVIDTKHFGTVDVSPENFKITAEEMNSDEKWQKSVGAKSGVYCITPDKLDIPF